MDRWIEHIEALSSGVDAVSTAVNGVVDDFLASGKMQNLQSTKTVEIMTTRMTYSSKSLIDCLTDLSSMGVAMNCAMLANPDEASSLMLNILNTLIKQLLVYYKDTCDSLQEAADNIRKGRAPASGINNLAASAQSVHQDDSNVAGTSDIEAHAISTKSLREVKKEGRVQEVAEEVESATGESDTQELRENIMQKDVTSKKAKHSNIVDKSDSQSKVESDRLAGIADETGDAAGKRRPASLRPMTQVRDAEYLQVMTTVEDALGRIVLSARPNVFTAPETISQRAPMASYYIALSYPGCLGPLLHANYVALDEEMQAEFLCDVLRSDYVEIEPFESPAGEVVVGSSTDLHSMPACAWRLGCSEDRHQLLYTMYILVDRGPDTPRSLLVHDVLCIEDDEREEALHIIAVLPEAPQFAKVTVHGLSPASQLGSVTRKYTSDRLSALVNITKSTFEKNGYVEVSEEETRQTTPKSAHLVHEELLTKMCTATPAFRGSVELASLDNSSSQSSWGLRDIAKGAVRGAAAVVKAPVMVTRAVGSAVLDASGVSDVIKNHTEEMFRKSFPEMASEEIIDTFNCALVEDGDLMPNQGILFITPHWLCFQSSITHTKFNLEWDDIKDVQKQRTVKLIENAIIIATHLDESYFLTSFVQRDQAFSLIMKQWLRK